MKASKLTTGKIRRELALLIESKKKEGVAENKAVTEARQEINKKYGHGWREKYDTRTQSYDEWWGECNMDGSFAYNGAADDF